jgi:hypothetical protein
MSAKICDMDPKFNPEPLTRRKVARRHSARFEPRGRLPPMTLRQRLLAALLLVGVMWGLLLGAAQIRLAHDRRYCGSSGPYASACIKARQSVRWGPYHAFGTNAGHD